MFHSRSLASPPRTRAEGSRHHSTRDGNCARVREPYSHSLELMSS